MSKLTFTNGISVPLKQEYFLSKESSREIEFRGKALYDLNIEELRDFVCQLNGIVGSCYEFISLLNSIQKEEKTNV